MSAQLTALDLFAGTGWGVACKRLGIREMGVEIMPEAIATRDANGMATIYRDVWDGLEGKFHVPAYQILIASPPCQTFSLAGKGSGRAALNEVLEAIELHTYKDPTQLREFGERHDPRTALVLAPLAHVWRDRPEYVAFEQVPTVLPVWEACAEVMREWGYSVDVAILNAEQYGVPQTRRRAILVGRLNGWAKLPTPTHSRYYSRTPEKLDPGVLPWVSMAQALGWGATDQPSHTIVAGIHGPTDRYASGGNSVRKALDAKIGTPVWVDKPEQDVDSRTTYAQRFDVQDVAALQTYPAGRGLTDRPSPTITGGGTEAGGAEPIAKYHERYTSAPGWAGSTERLSTAEAVALQTYPTHLAASGTSCQVVDPRPTTSPAPTITGAGNAEWGTRPTRAAGPRDRDPNGRAVTPDEAATIQTYEAPFVWPCTKTKAFLQIGNAVPPLLAQAVLTALTDPAA